MQLLVTGVVYAESTATSSDQTTQSSETDDNSEEDTGSTENSDEVSGNSQEGEEGSGGEDGSDTANNSTSSQDTNIETGDAFSSADSTTEANTTNTAQQNDEEEPHSTSSKQINEEVDQKENGTTTATTSADGATTTEDVTTPSDAGTTTLSSSTPAQDDPGTTTPEANAPTTTHSTSSNATTTGTTTVTIENDNTTDVTSNTSANAETGDNTATGENATISTGNAIAFANVINMTNTNIVNSSGTVAFFNQLFGNSSIDLRKMFSLFDNSSPSNNGDTSCSLSNCSDDKVNFSVKNNNDASITNNVVVRSSTGNNSVSGDGGDVSVSTGDAYAGANVVNVANTNITDSNYLLLSFNNGGSLDGDIVLPSKKVFANYFKNNASKTALPNTVTNSNSATIENNASTTASTGGNIASSSNGQASIATGNAAASSNVVNQVNSNIFGADSFLILLRVHKDWDGEVLGLPDGISWTRTSSGIQLFSTPPSDSNGNGSSTPISSGSGSTYVSNKNTATIKNNVKVYALTGDNKVTGDKSSSVQTGNAYAGSNIVNIANTNVLGQNWALLTFNIFGDWSGDIAFGRPDLWVGTAARAEVDPLRENSQLTYEYTVVNNSDTDATDVVIKHSYNPSLMSVDGQDHEHSRGYVTKRIGTVRAGEEKVVKTQGRLSNTLPNGSIQITSEVEVSSREKDDNLEDNSDTLTLTVHNPRTSHSTTVEGNRSENDKPSHTAPSNLEITKTAHVSTTTPSSSVAYTLSIVNKGGPAYETVLVDTLYDPNGDVLSEGTWELGKIYADEEITITYDIGFSGNSTSGNYINKAQIFGLNGHRTLTYGEPMASKIATTSVMLVDEHSPVTADTDICSRYITSNLGINRTNPEEEVAKLQAFLDFHGYNVDVTGVFDLATDQAVRSFQRKYSEDILTPWGVSEPTGYVYHTTKVKINNMHCGSDVFSFSDEELREMHAYRSQNVVEFQNTEKAKLEDEDLPKIGFLSCTLDTQNFGRSIATVDIMKKPTKSKNFLHTFETSIVASIATQFAPLSTFMIQKK